MNILSTVLDDRALNHLARATNGDLRSAFEQVLELATKSTPKRTKMATFIDAFDH